MKLKNSQIITVGIALILQAGLYLLGRTTPNKKKSTANTEEHGPNDGHDHSAQSDIASIDTILQLAKKQLLPEQALRLNELEHSISRGDVKEQQLKIYHQLAHFWADTGRLFEPYAWYQAEAARLENSEKSLNFAAHLFLANLTDDAVAARRRWKALQAKDLFERSLKLNPENDSTKVGLGATYMFGDISATPMEGIQKIREVVTKDSTHVYAQLMLARGSVISGQYDKAISRLETVNRLQPDNVDAILLLADLYERMKQNENAITWYRKSLSYIHQAEIRSAIEQRIKDLDK